MRICHPMEKKLVFLSPSHNQTSLDFCLQKIFSIRPHFFYSSLAFTSSTNKILEFSYSFQKDTLCRAKFLLTPTFPNTSLFQVFKLDFRVFNFSAKIKLKEPLKIKPHHQLFSNSLNPFSFNYIFSKRTAQDHSPI